MAKRLNITDAERAQIRRELDSFALFIEDVLADPTILDRMPDEAHVDAIPIEERDPGRRYDVETPRTVVTVTPSQEAERSHRKPA